MDNLEHSLDHSGASVAPDTNIVALRASDADREQIAALLRHHFERGRLDMLELEVRIGRCYAAATVDELRELVADLPRSTAHRPTFERSQYSLRPLPQPALIIPVMVVVLGLVGLTGGHALWLVWPLAFFFMRRRLFGRPARSPHLSH